MIPDEEEIVPEDDTLDEDDDLHEELERTKARRESQAVEIQRLRERRAARAEWERAITRPTS